VFYYFSLSISIEYNIIRGKDRLPARVLPWRDVP
jgi:hypothetical protein